VSVHALEVQACSADYASPVHFVCITCTACVNLMCSIAQELCVGLTWLSKIWSCDVPHAAVVSVEVINTVQVVTRYCCPHGSAGAHMLFRHLPGVCLTVIVTRVIGTAVGWAST
jgi:hypothetical protein